VKIVMHGPLAGPDWHGNIRSFAPDETLEVDDSDEKAVAWCKGWVAMGATLVEDVAAPAPAEPSLAELKAQAEALDLPTYGTKAQLQERIDDANASE
jgi:hypothetical protein